MGSSGPLLSAKVRNMADDSLSFLGPSGQRQRERATLCAIKRRRLEHEEDDDPVDSSSSESEEAVKRSSWL